MNKSMRKARYVLVLLLSLLSPLAMATQITIVNMDGAGEGFSDQTPVAAVGGNSGTTLGAQRLIVFQHAAAIWESIVNSNVEILVEAKFDPLTCSAGSAILGSAGATVVHRDFTNAPIVNTWYPAALANSLANTDLSTNADIVATFNSQIDNNNNCLNNINWYYGIDGNGPANTIDLLTVVLHEIGHGLGFQTFVDVTTGSKLVNKNDVFMLNLEDHSRSQTWDQLNNRQRVDSSIDTADLHWNGGNVTSKTGNFTSGINQGHVRHFAPNPLQQGSSVSHFDTALAPNELMEPYITGPSSTPGIAVDLFKDIGWNIKANASPVISDIADVTLNQGANTQTSFVVEDYDDSYASLTFSFDIVNTSVITQSGLSVSGTGNSRVLNIAPNSTADGNTLVTVNVSDGVNTTSTSFTLTVINTPPSVTISTPLNNENFAVTDSILFEGTANDAEEGDISANIAWTSSIDGAIGTGAQVNASLSAGTHNIEAIITDLGGAQSNDIITINVYGDADADGMNDLWEINNFGDTSRDGTGDFDGDGISDLDEYLISIVIPNGDINNDGLINAVDLLLATRHITGEAILSALEQARADLHPVGAPNGVLNLQDVILLQNIVLNQ